MSNVALAAPSPNTKIKGLHDCQPIDDMYRVTPKSALSADRDKGLPQMPLPGHFSQPYRGQRFSSVSTSRAPWRIAIIVSGRLCRVVDEIRKDAPELERAIRQILARVANARRLSSSPKASSSASYTFRAASKLSGAM